MRREYIYFSLIALLVTLKVVAQNEAVTKDGKKVFLMSDGTWKYIDSTKTNVASASYECSDLIKINTDKITGETGVLAKDYIIVSDDGGKTGFSILLFKSSDRIVEIIKAVGAGSCIDDVDKVNILFRDGTRLELLNNGKYNCDAKFTLYFGGIYGKKKELELLKTKEIESMRVWTSDSYVEKDFTPEQSKLLMKIIECLANS